MNTLLSIFHLLLVLTHSRLVPDMSDLWTAVTQSTAMVQPVNSDAAMETPGNCRFAYVAEATGPDDKAILTPIDNSQEPIFHLLARKQVGWPRRQLFSNKLYLVYCRLKIGGPQQVIISTSEK